MRSAAMPRFSSKIPGSISYVILRALSTDSDSVKNELSISFRMLTRLFAI